MLRIGGLCTAVVAGVLVCAAFSQEEGSARYQGDNRAGSTLRLSDDPQPVELAARRVQRILQAIGLQNRRQRTQPPVTPEAKTDNKSAAAEVAVRDETDAAGDAAPALLPTQTQPSLPVVRDRPSAPINVSREPSHESFASRQISSSAPQPPEFTLRSTPPFTEGTAVIKSSRRTVRLAAQGAWLNSISSTEPESSARRTVTGRVSLAPLPPLRSGSRQSQDSWFGGQPFARDRAAPEGDETAFSLAPRTDASATGSSIAGPRDEEPQADRFASPAIEL